jgi:heat-inducible transcriptional repressor
MPARKRHISGDEPQLKDREAEVLRCVIEAHVQSGEPVGSSRISKVSGLNLSAASIRACMAKLEELALLSQPHTSAGRLPTDKAFRIYVNQILNRPRTIEPSGAEDIDRALMHSRGEIPDMLGEASRQLSHFSQQVGLVLIPDLHRVIIERVEFVKLDNQRLVAILLGRSGVVHHRILEIDQLLEQTELDRIGQYLTSEFGGVSLTRMREVLIQRITADRDAHDRLERLGHKLGRQAVDPDGSEQSILVEGASNLFGSPEFADMKVMQNLLKTLEDKQVLVDLLSRLLDRRGVQVVIGEETESPDLSPCSVVASTYHSGDRIMGSVAIVGPKRMAYKSVIPLVDYLSKVLSRLLSGPDHADDLNRKY